MNYYTAPHRLSVSQCAAEYYRLFDFAVVDLNTFIRHIGVNWHINCNFSQLYLQFYYCFCVCCITVMRTLASESCS